MKWSPQQDAALQQFRDWYKVGAPGGVFHLFGFAGTGKTTLALELSAGISGNVLFAAYTGKAASVMRAKGCKGASTIHSLIYKSKTASRLRLVELELKWGQEEDPEKKARLFAELTEERKRVTQPNFALDENSPVGSAALLIIDEVSMVDGRIGEDLMSFGTPILVLGDPAQLPPVMGSGFFMTPNPTVMLTEVHRTALDNPVLMLATKIRNGEEIEYGDYGDSAVVRMRDLADGCALDYDQVLVGKNVTRVGVNRKMRKRLGRENPLPEPEDRVICLRNNHDLGLLNGTLFRVNAAEDSGYQVLMTLTPDDGGPQVDVEAFRQPFLGEDAPRWNNEGLEEFTYGYAITCHKAQGSEWRRVFIVDESAVFRADRNRWLYTAITRASEAVTVVR